jgi:regulator of RNase E activity RraB
MIEFYELLDDENIPYRCDVELDLIEEAPQEERPWLLWLFVKAQSVTDELEAFSNDLITSLNASLGAVFAGRVMKEGWAEFYFYASHAKRFENISSEVMSNHGGYVYERGSSRDSKWEMYSDNLFPDPYALLSIQNRHTISALLEAGDDLTREREVEHYLFFQTKTSMERTVAQLASHSYSPKEYVNDEESDYAYGVILVKNEAITPEIVSDTTTSLYESAIQEHGIYEGWSTIMGEQTDGAE